MSYKHLQAGPEAAKAAEADFSAKTRLFAPYALKQS